MTRAMTLLLTLAIAMANAICVCAMPAAKQSQSPAPRRACHATKPSKNNDHQNQPAPRECGHCTGVASADTAIARMTAPPMTLLDPLVVAPQSPAIFAETTSPLATPDHAGLSPPA